MVSVCYNPVDDQLDEYRTRALVSGAPERFLRLRASCLVCPDVCRMRRNRTCPGERSSLVTSRSKDSPISRPRSSASPVRYNPGSLRQTTTIRSPLPISDDELWRQFNEALRSVAHTTVRLETEGTYEIVPIRDAAGAAFIELAGAAPKSPHPDAGFRVVLISTAPL